jgi:hypothetical protein
MWGEQVLLTGDLNDGRVFAFRVLVLSLVGHNGNGCHACVRVAGVSVLERTRLALTSDRAVRFV